MVSCLQILEACLCCVLITLLNVTLIILTLSVSRLLNLLLRQVAFLFFFQAEDGIRDVAVTGVQTCALPISSKLLPPVLDAIEAAGIDACVVTANGKVFPLSESDIEQKVGRENLDRMEKLGIPLFQNEPRNADAYTYIGVTSRGTPVWIHYEVARRDVKIAIGQAQANHWGYGGGGKLVMPGVSSDETIESNHCNFVPSPQTHYGALAGPMRSDIDEIATMVGLDATMNVLLDTRGRVIELNFGPHPSSHR